MIKTKIAIVGAGPAGAIAAQYLASRGVDVVLIDRAIFPREKICGDGLTGEGLKVLERLGLSDWMRQFPTFTTFRTSSPDGEFLDVLVEVPEGECYGRTIPRRILDEKLLEIAVQAGARLVEGVKVRKVVRDIRGEGLTVVGDKEKVFASGVILADGSHAPVSRYMGLVTGWPEMIAARQYLTGDQGQPERLEMHFQQSIAPGYNWLFPMGDGRVNVGSFTDIFRLRRGFDLEAELARFIADERVTDGRLMKTEADSPVRSFPLRMDMRASRTHSDGIVLAGDAAGLISPLTGEGISPAIVSGELVAKQMLASAERGDFSEEGLSAYTRSLREHFFADWKANRLLSRALKSPAVLNRIFKNMRRDPKLALLICYIMIGQRSPRFAFRPDVFLRLFL